MQFDSLAPPEPSWAEVFPSKAGDKATQAVAKRLRAWAHDEWARVVPSLVAARLLTPVDLQILLDHCSAVALHRECLRQIARDGLTVETERGWTKNPATTILAQQRDRLKHTVQQLGLSPLARDGLEARGEAERNDSTPFD